MSKKLYLIESVSVFRQRYVVEAKDETDAVDEAIANISSYNEDWKEFSQQFVGEMISSSREISNEEYIDLYNKDNDYAATWSDEKKLKYVNKINYKD